MAPAVAAFPHFSGRAAPFPEPFIRRNLKRSVNAKALHPTLGPINRKGPSFSFVFSGSEEVKTRVWLSSSLQMRASTQNEANRALSKLSSFCCSLYTHTHTHNIGMGIELHFIPSLLSFFSPSTTTVIVLLLLLSPNVSKRPSSHPLVFPPERYLMVV